jgi:hypothetical protein
MLAHIVAGFVFTIWAIRRLRPVAADAPIENPAAPKTTVRPIRRPAIGARPVFWKMLYCDSRRSMSRFNQMLNRIIYLISYAPVLAVMILAMHFGTGNAVQEAIGIYNRIVVTMVMCGVLLFIAGLTAGCIGRERVKQTLDELLLTDLSTDEILRQKWLGCVWIARWMFLWVALHWALALAVGAVHPLAIPVLALLWCIYLMYAASMGLYFSARAPTQQRANFWTTMVGFLLVMAPLSAGMITVWITRGQSEWFATLLTISPPAALGVSSFSSSELTVVQMGQNQTVPYVIAGIALSALIHAALAGWFWRGAKVEFPRSIGR